MYDGDVSIPGNLGFEYDLTMRILAIAACVGLMGVGLAPDFKDAWTNKYIVDRLH